MLAKEVQGQPQPTGPPYASASEDPTAYVQMCCRVKDVVYVMDRPST